MIGLRRDCREIEPLLWNYAARTLPEQEIERVEAHLGACASCRQQAEEYRMTVVLSSDFRERLVPESETGWMQMRAQIEALQEPSPVRTLRPRWTLPVWSGAALAAAAVALFFLRSGPPTKPVPAVDISPLPGVAAITPPVRPDKTEDQTARNSPKNPTKNYVAMTTPDSLSGKQSPAAPERQDKPRPLPNNWSVAGRKTPRSESRVVRQTPEPRRIVPEKSPAPEPRPLLAKRDLGVDGERLAGSDLSQQFVAYMVPQNENTPPRRSYVMDQIPVTASTTTPVSTQPQAQELQAW